MRPVSSASGARGVALLFLSFVVALPLGRERC